jgi:hypothetical protein
VTESHKLCYVDSEGDEIVLGNNTDLDLARDDNPTLRVYLQGEGKPKLTLQSFSIGGQESSVLNSKPAFTEITEIQFSDGKAE